MEDERTAESLETCFDESTNGVHELVNYERSSSLSVRHYDQHTTEPISYALTSLDDILQWQRSQASQFNVATVPLVKRLPPLETSSQRTLVCHDMMGGYLDDRFIQGAKVEDPYAFYHWEYIDIFNYFSHNIVTIPPVTWTNAAHKHGVLVLGTFITEWTSGAEACEEFLKDEESYRKVADKLVQIAHCYGFDGWLINIENVLSEKAVKNTPLFLRYLTDQMHERIMSSQVLWYDSVVEDGSLKWQNELNDSNRVFFQACDGFFTNYNWTKQSLEWMEAYPIAKHRLADIYVGIDVFARGEVVGGKFETHKAMELIRTHGLSAAIFAPGWVYECHDKKDLRANQDKFWRLLNDFLSVHRPSCSLPFISSFCQGFGHQFCWNGKVQESRSWLNLSAQEVQPLYLSEDLVDGGWVKTRGCPQDAWAGGSSLMLEGVIPSKLTKLCAKIFSLHVPLVERTFISFIYKPLDAVAVSLEIKTADVMPCSVSGIEKVPLSSIQPQPLGEDHLLVKQFTQSCAAWMQTGWTVKCFLLKLSGCALLDICVNVAQKVQNKETPFQCRIGEIMVLDADSLHEPLPPVGALCLEDVTWQRGTGHGMNAPEESHLSATLLWRYPVHLARQFRVHWCQGDVPGSPPILIGRSSGTMFRVCGLAVPDPPNSIEFLVEPVGGGMVTPESHWGRLMLSYSEEEAK